MIAARRGRLLDGNMTFNIETVGVIGAGQMGAGIAEVAAQAGLTVFLNDVAEERVNAALATINGHLSRQVAKGQIDEAERKASAGRGTPITSPATDGWTS